MMGFGGELVLFTGLGFVVLGPKRMNELLARIAKLKAEFDKTTRALKSELTASVEGEATTGEQRPL
jgi:Sec-independent protein translocase protein TatA